jgi:outer membrane lipoprotein SlyB
MMKSKTLMAFAGAVIASTALMATEAAAACRNCGSVIDMKTVVTKGESSGAGLVLGGVAGGVLGHQVGSGRGNTAATVVGAGAGAYAGNEIEKNNNKKTTYQVIVKMEEGDTRTFTFAQPTSYRIGDRIKVIDGKLNRN